MHEGNVDTESRSEHAHTRARRIANFWKIHAPFSLEAKDFGEENDVFSVEFHTGGVYLKAIPVAGETFIEGFHREHAALGGCGGCH